MIWVNLQVTGATVPYNYAKLEEAVFAQYGHGTSRDVPAQAANFLCAFARIRPFARGNDACAFVGCVAFLNLNGIDLQIADAEAASWARRVWSDAASAVAELRQRAAPSDTRHDTSRGHDETVRSVLARFPTTVEDLVTNEAPVPVG
jgi:prophage maintenance system killer protein